LFSSPGPSPNARDKTETETDILFGLEIVLSRDFNDSAKTSYDVMFAHTRPGKGSESKASAQRDLPGAARIRQELVTRGWRARSPVARRATRGSTAGWTRPGAGTIVAGTPSRRRGPAGAAAWTAGGASRRPGAEAGDTDTSTMT